MNPQENDLQLEDGEKEVDESQEDEAATPRTKSKKSSVPVWLKTPMIEPRVKRKSLFPKSSFKQVLLYENPNEARFGALRYDQIHSQQKWSNNSLESQKRAFIIRQLLQQQTLKFKGVSAKSFLPDSVIESHKKLAHMSVLGMSYLGGKDMPMHTRLDKFQIKRKFSTEFFLEPTNDDDKETEKTPTELIKVDEKHEKRKKSKKKASTPRVEQDDEVEEVERANKIDILQLHRLPTVIGDINIEDVKSKNDISEFEKSDFYKSKSFHHNDASDKCENSPRQVTKLPELNSSSKRPTLSGRVQIAKKDKKYKKSLRGQEKPNLVDKSKEQSVLDLRFKGLEELLSPPHTTPRDGYVMLSSSTWDGDSPIKKEDQKVIKQKFMPQIKRPINNFKFNRMIALASGDFTDDDGNIVYHNHVDDDDGKLQEKSVKFHLDDELTCNVLEQS